MAQIEPTAEALQSTIHLLTVLRDPTSPQVSYQMVVTINREFGIIAYNWRST